MDRAELTALMVMPAGALDDVVAEFARIFKPPAWHADAACRERPELEFVPRRAASMETLKLCESCLVRRECLAYALEREELTGIWGGATSERREVARERGLSPDEVLEELEDADPPLKWELELERDLSATQRRRIRGNLERVRGRQSAPRSQSATSTWSSEPCRSCGRLLSKVAVERGNHVCSACRAA